MSIIDIEQLLKPISVDAPSGENLEYDSDFLELLRLAQGSPELHMGDEHKAAEEPNWREIKSRCLDISARTRSLVVIMLLNKALIRLEGLQGLGDGLELLNESMQKYWDTIYPLLDPDDANDPTERVNIIASLAASPVSSGNEVMFIQALWETPLIKSKELGAFTLRDIRIANGDLPVSPDKETKLPDIKLINAAVMSIEAEDISQTLQLAELCYEHMRAIDSFLMNKVGVEHAPDFNPFQLELNDIRKYLSDFLKQKGVDSGGDFYDDSSAGVAVGGAADSGKNAALSGEIRSTQDVLAVFKKICRYYQNNEPSSPIPLMIKRAERLVSKNFVEIVKDLTPDGIRQLEEICGIDTNEYSEE